MRVESVKGLFGGGKIGEKYIGEKKIRKSMHELSLSS
jgi:hypothetical protein